MGSKPSFLTVFFVFTILFTSSAVQLGGAMRPLNEKPLLNKYFPGLALIQSLQAGPVPPIGGSPCTNIPGSNGGSCTSATLTGSMNIAGGVVRAPPAIPRNVDDMAVAS